MKIVNIPTPTAADPAERLVEFYLQLGWDGESELDPTLVRLTREDAVALLDAELQYARKSRPDDPTAMARIGLLWMNWGPSSQGSTPGKVELHPGWFKNENAA
jgi:hypothetical protein